MKTEEPRWPQVPMDTEDAEEIINLTALYCRNQWDPGESTQESRKTILEAARVLLDGDERGAEKAEAARELWATVKLVEEALGWIAPWGLPRSELKRRNKALASAHDALARYSEFAPDQNESG